MLLSSKKTNTNEVTTAELDTMLYGISKGDRSSFEQFYLNTRSSVYSFALSILKNTHDAEDVLHDCYIAVWHGAGNYRSQGKPLAWMMTITRNLCLQQIRTHQRTEDFPQDEWELHLSDNGELTIEDKSVLSACMEMLSEQERQIITLHAVSGFKHREIAELLDRPLPTVLSKYNRAIKRLKKYLQ